MITLISGLLLQRITNLELINLIEIFLISTGIYYLLCWLSYDQQKNLVFWFYGYVLLYMFCWNFNLATLHFLMLASTPFIACMFCLIHQKTLQKNFIALTKLQPNRLATGNWLEEVMQSCLRNINTHHEIMYIIERNDLLDLFLQAPYVIDAPIQQNFLELLINMHQKPAEPVVVWITQRGFLHTCNPVWTVKEDTFWINPQVQQLSPWQQKALIITEKTDALVLTVSPITRMCSVMVKDKLVQSVSPHQAFQLIKKYCLLSDTSGELYDNVIQKAVHQKQTSA